MGEAGERSDVLVDVLTPFPPFAHFSINDLEWFDYFFTFAKHLQRLGVIETPVELQFST